MKRQRDAESLPGRPHDSSGMLEQKELLRRTLKVGLSGAGLSHTPTGSIITIKKPRRNKSHPWKVRANGDDTVTIAAGEIMSYGDSTFGDLSTKHYASYEGGTATVTAAGVIYGQINGALSTNPVLNDTWIDSNGDDVVIAYYRVVPDILDEITVNFAATMPSSNTTFYFEIAKVNFVDDVASVTKQVLTHNPTLSGLSS